MFPIHQSRLPKPEANFRADLQQYKNDLAAHSLTVNVPAPFPENRDLLQAILNDPDKDFFVIPDDTTTPKTPEEIRAEQREQKRNAALRVLTEQQLADAALDPLADPAIKEYANDLTR